MGYSFVPECNDAQESDKRANFCHICRTTVCLDLEMLLPQQHASVLTSLLIKTG